MEFFLETAWVIAAIPLLASVLIATFARYLREKAWYVGASGMLVALIWSLFVLGAVITGAGDGHGHDELLYFSEPAWQVVWTNWAPFGDYPIHLGLQVDGLTAIMLMVVTLVSFCVQVYSSAYLHGDKRFTRFYAAINLFTLGMLGLVLADNLFLLLVSWEIMGLCSYLLIGHWYELEWPRMGQIKAFLTTRVGDVGMMVGIWIIFMLTRTMSFKGLAEELPKIVEAGGTDLAILSLGALLLFTGAMGKSAQFPLHTWLPDAMAGPTPGSALIHAATMVAAGVYLVARSFMVFGFSNEWVLIFVAFIGAFTSIFAASIATVRRDLKEVLAYSTISQLGYMIMALGLGGWAAGSFHLMTHAFFKALLFLCAGSIIHAHHHNQLMHKMGGLRKKIPITFITWMIGYLALAGFPGFSGFFSKDELLLAAWTWHPHALEGMGFIAKLPFIMGLGTAFLTAYYMTRATHLIFFGKPRDMELYEHAHESPKAMTIPLIILAVPAAISGWFWAAVPYYSIYNLTGIKISFMKFFADFFHLPGIEHEVAFSTELLVTGMATAAGFLGIGLGLFLYRWSPVSRRVSLLNGLRPLHTVLLNKYYVDEFYEVAIIKSTQSASRLVAWFDGAVVDGAVNLAGKATNWFAYAMAEVDKHVIDRLVTMWADIARALASVFRRFSTGYVQQYMLTVAVVVVASVLLFQVIR